MDPITETISPERTRTRIQAEASDQRILRAILGPAAEADSRAAVALLEGLALWTQRPLSVVVCVARGDTSSGAIELCDALEVGRQRLFFDVGVALLDPHALRRRPGGVGEFRDLTLMTRRAFR